MKAEYMELRDFFAASALQGFCANQKALKENVDAVNKMFKDLDVDISEKPRDMLAFLCYQIADAMIKIRAEKH